MTSRMPSGPTSSIASKSMAAVGAALVTALLLGCGESEPVPPDEPGPRASDALPRAGAAAEPARIEPVAARRRERPLPAFTGPILGGEPGERLNVSSLLGRRLLIAFFNPEVDVAESTVEALVRIAPLRGKHNFEIVGVAVGSTRSGASAFARRLGIDFPVIDDSSGAITRLFDLRTPVTLFGVDAEGYVTYGSSGVFARNEEAVRAFESKLRQDLRLPPADHEDRAPGLRPRAPTFTAALLEGGSFDLAEHQGKPVVLLFFLHTCPHCHEVLSFLKRELEGLPPDRQPVMVGLELTGKTGPVRRQLARDGLDFFPVIFDDAKSSVQKAYGVFAGVPDLLLIDASGHIVDRVQGWSAAEEPLVRMRLAKLVGAPVPMLLSAQGYTGSEVCGVCHESEHQTWQLTRHARAFDTLVTHGSDADPECVGCHVVGFGETEGFQISPRTRWLENVGCESCHGRGGPHRSPDFMKTTGYEKACAQCHDAQHSLGFEFATFLPRISHAANRPILELPAAERERALAARGAVRKSLLPTQAAYVGSAVCGSCHGAEHATWSQGPHARAMQTLASAGRSTDADCQRCHTTGFGMEGGFTSKSAPEQQADLARVGCESCHGPGGNHVAADVDRLGSIVSLGDKCDSCVILQICGSCHDDVNDPGFEFEVQAKIDRIRHGTVEAGTGRPLPAPGEQSAALHARAARVFARLDGQSGEVQQ